MPKLFSLARKHMRLILTEAFWKTSDKIGTLGSPQAVSSGRKLHITSHVNFLN